MWCDMTWRSVMWCDLTWLDVLWYICHWRMSTFFNPATLDEFSFQLIGSNLFLWKFLPLSQNYGHVTASTVVAENHRGRLVRVFKRLNCQRDWTRRWPSFHTVSKSRGVLKTATSTKRCLYGLSWDPVHTYTSTKKIWDSTSGNQEYILKLYKKIRTLN